MTRYIIALSELGLKNNNLISLLREHSYDIVDMFENKNQSIFEKNLDLMPLHDIFSDSSAVDLALSKADYILTSVVSNITYYIYKNRLRRCRGHNVFSTYSRFCGSSYLIDCDKWSI